jgi:RHS repeat-associated protein
MKTKLTFALVAILTNTAFAEFKAPLPEFKNEKQLAEWRAAKASEATSQGYASQEAAFYTGKLYLASTGGYAFKYRSYDPKLARWTSEDPSGFPDGANGSCYAPNPTSELDFEGLATLAVTDDGNGTPANHANAISNWAWSISHNGNIVDQGQSAINRTATYVNQNISQFAGLTLRGGTVGQDYTFSFVEAYNFQHHDESFTFHKNTSETYQTNNYGDWRETGWSVTAICFDVFGNSNYNSLNNSTGVNDGVKLLSNSNIGGGISTFLKNKLSSAGFTTYFGDPDKFYITGGSGIHAPE